MTGAEAVGEYLREVAKQFATGAATEHSYRPALQRLLAGFFPKATVVNEPSRIECGAPDFLVRENGPARRPIGYVEAKDIGDGDLDGNGPHREQFDRYKAELSNIVFTDYLDFHFYEDGEFVAKCRVAEVAGNRIVPASPEELERFAGLLAHFAEVAPKRIASPSRLAHLMAGKARLLARAVAATLCECKIENGKCKIEDSPIYAQYQAFRQWLVHDLDADSFADVYAQTIVYGMFAARFHDTTPEDFSRAEAASLIPRSNPLLRRLFRDLDEYVDESIVWIIDDLVALFAASDVAAIMQHYAAAGTRDACPYQASDGRVARPARPPDRDPLLHFYEDFLAAYNPSLRKQRGVWYTPAPVVGFIVRSVDAILRRDFGLPAGLADASKTRVKVVNDDRAKKGDAKFVEREMHRVQILDPAAGTGTFLAETVRHIRAKFAGQEGMWPGYVRDHLVPRLNGFEILMASYAMAHLKLDMLLSESALTGFTGLTGLKGQKANPDNPVNPVENSRLRVFLTNSLEEFSETTGTLWAMELSNESREADFIKRDCPVMVVMGNPPYSVSSSNKSEWIQRLVADYKKGLGEKKINLDDDYIKFIRLGQHYIDRNGEGILAYISNNSFLDGITHREMRKSLMESFDEIYILDLHGNARKKETAPDGSKDENVFDIMQGVSINIFVKRNNHTDWLAPNGARETGGSRLSRPSPDDAGATSAPLPADTQERVPPDVSRVSGEQIRVTNNCRVYHAEVFGEREAKYGFLDAHDLTTVEYKRLAPQAPYYFFVPKDFALQEEYEKGFSVAELMPVNNSGIQTKRDDFVYQYSASCIERIVAAFKSKESTEEIRKAFGVGGDGVAWSLEKARQDVLMNSGRACEVLYHPFDKRQTYFTGVSSGLMARPRMPQSAHLLHDNMALLLVRNTRRENPFNFFVADTIVDKDGISGFDNCRFFPLYLYMENMGKVERTANLNPEIVAKIGEVFWRERALAYYRRFELGRTWYDVVPRSEVDALVPIEVTPDPTADRRKVKEIFRRMPPVRNERDGRVVTFPVASVGKLLRLYDLNVLGVSHAFEKLFSASVRIYSENAEIPNHKAHRNITAYHQYVAKMRISCDDYYVRFTVREDLHGNFKKAEVHGTSVSRIVIYKAEGAELSGPAHSRVEDSTPLDDNSIAFPSGGVNGVCEEKTKGAELSLRTHAHGEDSASFNRSAELSGPAPKRVEDSASFDTHSIAFPVGGVKRGPFVDWKMALYLSFNLRASASLRDETIPNNPVNPVQKPSPEDIFHYVYAVLYTPQYRERYREFLKVDFPRIPYPKDATAFRRLAAIGERLVQVHLLKDPKVRDMFSPYANFPVAGDNRVETVRFEISATKNTKNTESLCEPLCPLWLKETAFRVYINNTQYFDNVPEAAWNFYIGGYQPAQKWLKDRKGRALSSDDIMHYKALIAALVETGNLMEELRKAGGKDGK